MRTMNSLGNRMMALLLCMVMIVGMLPGQVFAQETAVAQIGAVKYDTLAEAIAAVPTGTNKVAPAEVTTIKLLQDTAYAFDVGTSTGSKTMNLKLDLNDKTLTLSPSVGSVGTKSNGIRVLAFSKLEVVNGKLVCSSKTEDNVKVGIANYGTLVLGSVEVQKGDNTIYTINNRGALTLSGTTKVTAGSTCAITNDPYNYYYTENFDASVTCDSADVVVESMQMERYERTSNNQGKVALNISGGYFGKIVEDGESSVGTAYAVTGGTIGVSTTEELELAIKMIQAGAAHSCPANPVTIKLLDDLSGSFDVGISTGKAPKNIVLDLNDKTLTLRPGIGSFNTKSNGIRVLAYSKLVVKNGTLQCSSDPADNIKVGIANYSDLLLDNVDVKSGDQTLYTINNRGKLDLTNGTTVENAKVAQSDYADSTEFVAITNDPYNMYYDTPIDAQINCADENVEVGNIQLETYGSQGDIQLNISKGKFGGIYEPEATGTVEVEGNISGGSFKNDVEDYCVDNFKPVESNGSYVVKQDQTQFGFAQAAYEMTYGQSLQVVPQNGNGTITYSVIEGANVVQVDGTGKLTALKAGTAKIKAVAAGNDDYNTAEATYNLTVKPAYGTVSSFSGGNLANDGTAAPVLTIEEATLTWVAKNESIGRMEDGWWVGLKVYAPAGIDKTKVVIQKLIDGDNWSADIAYVEDGAGYEEFWGRLTAEILAEAKAAGKNKTFGWRFSWDGDETFEQVVKLTVVPDRIVLKQAAFAFEKATEEITYGEAYTIPALTGGNGSKVVYDTLNEKDLDGNDANVIEIDENTGVVTVNQSGTVTIRATKSGDFYENAEATYALTVQKATQPAAFGETDLSVTYNDNGNFYTKTVSNAAGTVTYTIVEELYEGAPADVADINETSGTLTIKQSGTVKVKATVTGNEKYLPGDATYTLTVNKDDQPATFGNTDPEVTYTENGTCTQTVSDAAGTVTYTIVEELYEDAPADVADINETNGTLTIKQSGTVTVKATVTGDEKYLPGDVTYTLTINKAEQDFSFVHADVVDVKYGTSFETEISKSDKNSGLVSYSVAQNTIGAAVDAAGKVTFSDTNNTTKVGDAKVAVQLLENACYKASDVKEYTVRVSYEAFPQGWNPLAGNTANAAGWYKTNVVITPPAGYVISNTNTLSNTAWESTHTWETDGQDGTWAQDNKPEICLKNTATGAITDIWYLNTLKLDREAPKNLKITYTTNWFEELLGKIFDFSHDDVEVELTAEDVTSGIAKVEYKFHGGEYEEITSTNGEYKFTATNPDRGQIFLRVTDVAGNTAEYAHTKDGKIKELVVDNVNPKVTIQYAGTRKAAVTNNDIRADVASGAYDANTRFIYNDAVTVTIEVEEANFFKDTDLPISVYRDGSPAAASDYTESAWVETTGDNNETIYVKTLELTANGDYQIKAEYMDHSHNEMQWTGSEYGDVNAPQAGTKTYESNIHTVDTTKPKVQVTYDNNTVAQEVDGMNYYDADRTATITVEDRNFRPSEVQVQFTVDADDLLGQDVGYIYSELDAWENWTRDSANENLWTATVPMNVDAKYTVHFAYADLAENAAADYSETFVVDKTAAENLTVAYRSKDDTVLNKILKAVTFGNYKAKQEVVLTMQDITSGVDYIKLTATAQGADCATDLVLPVELEVGADGKIRSENNSFVKKVRSSFNTADATLTLAFDVPAQFRGTFAYTAWDMSGNEAVYDKNAGTLVVDTIAPGHTVSYNPSNVVDADTKKDLDTFDAQAGITDITSTDDSYVMYFNGDATATIAITEANFEGKQVTVQVLDAAGNEVTGWKQSSWKKTTAQGATDVYTKTVTISKEGDYRVKVFYQDHSMNKAVDYLSQRIVVDKTAPVISVAYGNTDVKNTIDGRDYFNAQQTATVTIQEHNFRAEDVQIMVTAKDVLDQDVLKLTEDGYVKSYAQQGTKAGKWSACDAGTWRREDDTFVLDLTYKTDANYTFDIAYTDMAQNEAADYTADSFTVDTTAPENLTVSYSTSFFEQVKQSVSFGYYNAKMKVTITAEDDTSGIYHFAYSYIKAQNVSGVNAELLDQAIRQAKITYEGKKATATFSIPKMVLGNDNQFNGTVEFTAFDRSEWGTQLKDSKVIVVDNIAPKATISYNKPVNSANGTSYYDGSIEATIVINEANFDSKDVVVTVTRDGSAYPVAVSWTDDSTDVHTGIFTLTRDGDYIVKVSYADKSGNQMTNYTSNKLTLDTEAPTIRVTKIQQNSANKDEKYSFVITVNDTNLDMSGVEPVLKAVMQENGAYKTVDVDLGKANVVTSGKTVTYKVDNLENDGLYTLTCDAKDMAKNATAQIGLEDRNSYKQVQFSINRNGSVFAYGNDYAQSLAEKYYIYSVDEDVVIEEVNVDPIEEYKVTLNGNDLTEGSDYTTSQTSDAGQWSKRTYTVKKSVFEAEGEYSLVVSSVDKTQSAAFSDIKNLSMVFVVDRTAPVVTISGMKDGGRYQTDAQTVTLIPSDEGGRLNYLSVVVMDSRGNALKDAAGNEVGLTLSGDELRQHLLENDGMVTFTIPKGLNNQIRVICSDSASDNAGLANEYNMLFERVTVNANGLVIFYANTGAFVGTIVGVLALIALIIFLIKRKKDKKAK